VVESHPNVEEHDVRMGHPAESQVDASDCSYAALRCKSWMNPLPYERGGGGVRVCCGISGQGSSYLVMIVHGEEPIICLT